MIAVLASEKNLTVLTVIELGELYLEFKQKHAKLNLFVAYYLDSHFKVLHISTG